MAIRRASTRPGPYEDQGTLEAIDRALRLVADRQVLSYGDPRLIVASDYRATIGELIRVRPTDGDVTITLPRFAQSDVGKAVTIINCTSSTRSISVRSDGGLVNGVESLSVSSAYSVRQAVAAYHPEQLWVLTSVRDGSLTAGDSPIWEWNGIDLTQFDGASWTNNVDSVSVSVISHCGVNWIEIIVDGDGNGLADQYRHSAVLPISADLGDNYRLECTIKPMAASQTLEFFGLGCRLSGLADGGSAGALPCNGYIAGNSSNATSGRLIQSITTSAAGDAVYIPSYNLYGGAAQDDLAHACSIECSGSSIVRAKLHHGGDLTWADDAGTHTTGRAGLYASASATANTIRTYLYRDIKVWAV